MKKGKDHCGVIGNTQQPEIMVTWVHSMNAAKTLTNDLRTMSKCRQHIRKNQSHGSRKMQRTEHHSGEFLRVA